MERMGHVKRPVVNGVRLQVPGGRVPPVEGGTLCITAFFLIFSSRQSAKDEVTVLYTSISHLDYKAGSSGTVLYLKDFRRLQFEFSSPDECKELVDALEILCRPEDLGHLYAFNYRPSAVPASGGAKWGAASPGELLDHWKCSLDKFRVSTVNRNFALCSSYPEEVIVPVGVSDEDIVKVASVRHGNRFPVVCYHHSPTGAVLVRCGQPLCGHTQRKLKEDVSMLNAYLPSRSRGRVIDVRPQNIAQQHMSKGGGVESPANYPQWKVEHAKFESPAGLQASLNKLMDACYDASLNTSSSWFGRVESSGWLTHVSRLLKYAWKIALAINGNGSSVVVHGSLSRDTTLQLTSLSQVLLDYKCRTMSGFVELVEREWLDGGHQFSQRHHHSTHALEKEKAPVFLLFLDAVWQVMQQFPLSFQFNERFLHTLLVHSYSSQYGNFLYDTPKERRVQELKEKSYSLWDSLSIPENSKQMLNPIYEKNSSVLQITVTTLNVSLWRRLYLRTDALEQLELPGYEALRLLKEESTSRHERLQEVKRELEALQVKGRKYASNWS